MLQSVLILLAIDSIVRHPFHGICFVLVSSDSLHPCKPKRNTTTAKSFMCFNRTILCSLPTSYSYLYSPSLWYFSISFFCIYSSLDKPFVSIGISFQKETIGSGQNLSFIPLPFFVFSFAKIKPYCSIISQWRKHHLCCLTRFYLKIKDFRQRGVLFRSGRLVSPHRTLLERISNPCHNLAVSLAQIKTFSQGVIAINAKQSVERKIATVSFLNLAMRY